MLKKILIIIAVTLILVVIGLFAWAVIVSRQSGGKITVTESFRELVSFGEGGTDFFSRRGSDEFGIDSLEADGILGDESVALTRLRQITNFPVAGATVVEYEDLSAQAGGQTLIRFMARENGHIFEMQTDSTTQKRISNTTILRIWDTKWLSGGDAFVARFLDEENSEIESFYAEIKQSETGSEGTIDGVFLPNDIKELALSSKDKIFYLISSGGGSTGIISDPDGDKKVQIFSSPLSGWNVQWAGRDKIALTTKASANILGYLYFLNTVPAGRQGNTEKLEKILSGIKGLTTLVNKNATRVLFTQNEGNRLLLSVINIGKEQITDLPIWTLSEKCIWSELNENIIYCGVPNIIPRAGNLDLWYQGLVSFSDSIWMIDIETQTANILASPEDMVGREIDLIKPILSDDENYLIFTDKKDSTLWQLKI